jgi:uncharacterized membrane protein YedE/YeeE
VLAGLFVMALSWSLQATTGYFGGFWTPPWGLASLFGGFVFGVGMTTAGGCASRTLYRAGQGYVRFWIALFFMSGTSPSRSRSRRSCRSTLLSPARASRWGSTPRLIVIIVAIYRYAPPPRAALSGSNIQ